MKPVELTGSTGEALVQFRVQKVLRFIYRQQPVVDIGIDGQLEICDDYRCPTSKLVALQVKTKEDYDRDSNGNLVYYGKLKHYEYWLEHSLPVLLFLVDLVEEQIYWERISDETVERTKKGWKITIPPSKRLDASARDEIAKIAADGATPYQRRLRRLLLDRGLMQKALAGGAIFADVVVSARQREDGRTPESGMKVTLRTGRHDEERYAPFDYASSSDVEATLRHLFPWARVTLDAGAYYDEDSDEYEQRELIDDQGEEPYSATPDGFDEWRDREKGQLFRPHAGGNAGNEEYSIILEPNEVARAFVTLDVYLSK